MASVQPPQSDLVSVNGVRLQSFDWGGQGPALVFLAGFGCTPRFFNWFASRFTDRYRVLGLSRRAHGLSETPESGYDIPTLAEDICAFLDEKGIDRAAFIGHSYAGNEMAQLAAAHPERVERLVFLDAAYDRTDEDRERLGRQPAPPTPLDPQPEIFESKAAYAEDNRKRHQLFRRLWDERWDAQLDDALEPVAGGFRERLSGEAAGKLVEVRNAFRPDYRAIRCPVLAIYAIPDVTWYVHDGAPADFREAMTRYSEEIHRPYIRRCAEQVRREVSEATVIELDGASHYCFFDREAEVLDAMQAFL